MKAFALSLAIASVSASNSVVQTNKECWNGENGAYVGDCSDVYFFTCDKYEVKNDASCNVYTFSDSRLTWLTSDITVQVWSYYINDD